MRRMMILLSLFFITLALFGCSEENAEVSKDSTKDTQEVVESSNLENSEVTHDIAQDTAEEEDPLAITKAALQNLYRENIEPIGEGEEYPADQTKELKAQLLELAEKGDYGLLLEEADKVTANYTFSEGDNLDIAGVIYDAQLIADIYGKVEDKYAYGEVVAKSVTPEMLIASTLWSDNFARRPVIEDIYSLAPIGFDHFDLGERRAFQNAEEANDEPLFDERNIAEEIFTFKDNVNRVYAYDVTLPNDGGLPLTVYLFEDLYGKLGFYGMYAPDDFKTYEQTLAWWMEQDVLFEQAEKQQEEYYEQQAEDGVITNEQIDKLFESGY